MGVNPQPGSWSLSSSQLPLRTLMTPRPATRTSGLLASASVTPDLAPVQGRRCSRGPAPLLWTLFLPSVSARHKKIFYLKRKKRMETLEPAPHIPKQPHICTETPPAANIQIRTKLCTESRPAACPGTAQSSHASSRASAGGLAIRRSLVLAHELFKAASSYHEKKKVQVKTSLDTFSKS